MQDTIITQMLYRDNRGANRDIIFLMELTSKRPCLNPLDLITEIYQTIFDEVGRKPTVNGFPPLTRHIPLLSLHHHYMIPLDVLAELLGHRVPHEEIHPERQATFL